LIDLIQQIRKKLDYYMTHIEPKEKKFSKILLCGGGANLKGIDDLLMLELGIFTQTFNPLGKISQDKKNFLMSEEEALKYSTAIGLALRGAVNNYDKSSTF